jgi:hypothetical protein
MQFHEVLSLSGRASVKFTVDGLACEKSVDAVSVGSLEWSVTSIP